VPKTEPRSVAIGTRKWEAHLDSCAVAVLWTPSRSLICRPFLVYEGLYRRRVSNARSARGQADAVITARGFNAQGSRSRRDHA
jgi:hypothetical protein